MSYKRKRRPSLKEKREASPTNLAILRRMALTRGVFAVIKSKIAQLKVVHVESATKLAILLFAVKQRQFLQKGLFCERRFNSQ